MVNYFRFLAQEVREYLAEMGFTRLDDIVGRTDLIELKPAAPDTKAALLDFGRLLHRVDNGAALHNISPQRHDINHVLDVPMLAAAREALDNRREVSLEYAIANTDRSVGAMLSGAVAARYGEQGLPDRTIQVRFKGSAGQSFGAFLARGISFRLEGEANDYLGKGLSGGHISVQPPVRSGFAAEDNTIAGNTLLYGATSGEVYINGRAGERFAVRNSGAVAVVEGVGDHCCEYMTGGRVVVLGETGRNFAAGMSGGVAYVWDKHRNFDYFPQGTARTGAPALPAHRFRAGPRHAGRLGTLRGRIHPGDPHRVQEGAGRGADAQAAGKDSRSAAGLLTIEGEKSLNPC